MQVRRPGQVHQDPPRQPLPQGALGVAALSAARSGDTYLAANYRRIASRRGPVKAIVAVEHAMLIAIWNMLINGVFYGEPGSDFYTRRKPRTGPSSAPSTSSRSWTTTSP